MSKLLAAVFVGCLLFVLPTTFLGAALQLGEYGPGNAVEEAAGWKKAYTPETPTPDRMGFWEAAAGQQTQNLIPKAWDWLKREKPFEDPSWENPVLTDPEVPREFVANFATASSKEEYDQIKTRLKGELDWSKRVHDAGTAGKLGVLASRILDPAVILACSFGLIVYSTISRRWFLKRQSQLLPRRRQPLAPMGSGVNSSSKVAWARFVEGALGGLGVVGAIGFFILGIAQLFAGYAGISHGFGTFWAIVAVVAAFLFRFTLPLTIGSFFGAMSVWGWNWFASALFALPGLVFVIPGVIASMISGVRGNNA